MHLAAATDTSRYPLFLALSARHQCVIPTAFNAIVWRVLACETRPCSISGRCHFTLEPGPIWFRLYEASRSSPLDARIRNGIVETSEGGKGSYVRGSDMFTTADCESIPATSTFIIRHHGWIPISEAAFVRRYNINRGTENSKVLQ